VSSLIKQSYVDIEALRARQNKEEGSRRFAEKIDFDKIEESLKKFEECDSLRFLICSIPF
jgi:hypothetical protein